MQEPSAFSAQNGSAVMQCSCLKQRVDRRFSNIYNGLSVKVNVVDALSIISAFHYSTKNSMRLLTCWAISSLVQKMWFLWFLSNIILSATSSTSYRNLWKDFIL